jgi:hypothetical protein
MADKVQEIREQTIYDSIEEKSSIATIPLSQGRFAIVDAEDFEKVCQLKWCYCEGYAVKLVTVPGTKRKKKIHMHHAILEPSDEFVTDHINNCGLDNRKCNLRLATKSQNQMNRTKNAGTSSKYKGVCFDNNKNRWLATIWKNRKMTYLGLFKTEVEAALAYNEAAKAMHGEFAKLNIIEQEMHGT